MGGWRDEVMKKVSPIIQCSKPDQYEHTVLPIKQLHA